MSKNKPQTAPVQDPRIAIREQGIQNRVGQVGPFGSATYEGNDQTGYNVRTQMSPELQGLFDRSVGLAGTDSVNQTMDPRLFQLAGSLMNRIQGRFRGADATASPMTLGSAPNRPVSQGQMPQVPYGYPMGPGG